MKRKALYAGKAELVPKKRRAPSRKGPPPPFLLALLLLFLGLLFMVWVRLEVLGLGYEISHLKAQKDELLLRKKELTLERASLCSAQEIERRAKEELSLVYPKEGQVVIIRGTGVEVR